MPSANGISSITSFKRRDYDIILTLTGSTNFNVQYLNFIDSREFTGYVSQLSPQSAEMMKPNKFGRPEGATVDDAGNIFIADAEKDTVFKFNSFGDELQSFGGEEILKEPYAVAFFDRTLYVCDTGNNRILRFILSTDLN